MTDRENPTRRKDYVSEYSSRILLKYADSLLVGIYRFGAKLDVLLPLLQESSRKVHEQFIEISEDIVENLDLVKKIQKNLRRKDLREYRDLSKTDRRETIYEQLKEVYVTLESCRMERDAEKWDDILRHYRQDYREQLEKYGLKTQLDKLMRKNRRMRQGEKTHRKRIYY